MEPGEGKMTASARLTALPEGWVQGRLQEKPVIPQDTIACCRESAECCEKMITRAQRRGEAGVELWVATAAGLDSRVHSGVVGRVHSWVAGSVSGQRGDEEAGPPRASQQRTHSSQSEKRHRDQEEPR